jgi:hypothetical protein
LQIWKAALSQKQTTTMPATPSQQYSPKFAMNILRLDKRLSSTTS